MGDSPIKWFILLLNQRHIIYSVSISEELVESAGKKAAVELGKVLAGGVAFGMIDLTLVTRLRIY